MVGLPTNLDFCERVAGHGAFERGGVTTAFLEEHGDEVMPSPEKTRQPAHAVVLASVAVLLTEVSGFFYAYHTIDASCDTVLVGESLFERLYCDLVGVLTAQTKNRPLHEYSARFFSRNFPCGQIPGRLSWNNVFLQVGYLVDPGAMLSVVW